MVFLRQQVNVEAIFYSINKHIVKSSHGEEGATSKGKGNTPPF